MAIRRERLDDRSLTGKLKLLACMKRWPSGVLHPDGENSAWGIDTCEHALNPVTVTRPGTRLSGFGPSGRVCVVMVTGCHCLAYQASCDPNPVNHDWEAGVCFR